LSEAGQVFSAFLLGEDPGCDSLADFDSSIQEPLPSGIPICFTVAFALLVTIPWSVTVSFPGYVPFPFHRRLITFGIVIIFAQHGAGVNEQDKTTSDQAGTDHQREEFTHDVTFGKSQGC
jgi:hypothetical protein